jgi:hypothetical protein
MAPTAGSLMPGRIASLLPSVMQSVEVLTAILHPDPDDPPPDEAWAWVRQPSG